MLASKYSVHDAHVPELLSEFSGKDRPWDRHKRNSRILSEHYKLAGLDELSERVRKCANYLEFRYERHRNGHELELRLSDAWFCRDRLCSTCSWRRSLRWIAKFRKGLPPLVNDHPNVAFLLLTLTVKNCDLSDLRETIKHLNKSWQRLSQRKNFPAIGYLKSIEVTRGKDGSAHPHLHIVLIVPKSYFTGRNYLSHEKWRELWQSCARLDYQPMVNIQRIKPPKDFKGTYIDGIIKGLREVTKYSVKPKDLLEAPHEWVGSLRVQLHGTRAIALGGILKNYMKEETPNEDLIGQSDDPMQDKSGDLLFGFKERLNAYRIIDK